MFLIIILFIYLFFSLFLFDGDDKKEEINNLPQFDDPHDNPNIRVGNKEDVKVK
jgi:hypothetical protein